jgi:hypothetical protein
MANVNYFFTSWVGSEGDDFYPGDTHYWVMWGFDYGNIVYASAHPVVGPPGERVLAVEDIRIEGDPSGRRLYCTVRNVGAYSMPAYGIGFSWVSK